MALPWTPPPRCCRARQRYGIALDAATQVLPVNGSREALFAFTQVVVDASQDGARVICPNPFYQIYEGATLLAGAQPYYAPSDAARNFAVDWDSVPADVWEKTQLIFVCSPGNPTGAVMPLAEWEKLFADRKSTRLNSSHLVISYAVFCLKKKKKKITKRLLC